MRLGKIAVTGAMTVGALTLTSAPALAAGAPQPTTAYMGGVVVTNGTTATVHISYTCTSVVSARNHLFVAVKQGPDVSPQNSSSETAHITSFLSTNWNSDARPNALTCDGKRHEQKIVVKPQPGFDSGPLLTGTALVQICVFDNITGADENGDPIGGFAPSYTMRHVVNTKPHA